ncbi:hypothetical protein Scep_010453 [Stephania cephalantha]|uniref:Ubiquitin carboxyl-terminal hydrolase n=1 Tax=Stephania cephalantha TaxID=152367 RepID=A0AAP0JV56_9MAGN
MGKKIKKKGRNPQKERRISHSHVEIAPKSENTEGEIGDSVVMEVKERKGCAHVEKGVDLSVIASKIGSLESVKCEDCRVGARDRKESKGRGKHGKKKGASGGGDSKSVWICLECGHLACGGVGLPTTVQSHSLRHSRQFRHPCVIQYDNPLLRWCFPCNSLIPSGKTEEEGKHKDIFSDVVKLIKGHSSEGPSVDVETIWFENETAGEVTKTENGEMEVLDGKGVRVVKGIMNLGNTCFFNSVLQNILSIDLLRDYFIKLDHFVGPMTMALKKLFSETSAEANTRSSLNPHNLLESICAKARQFRGYQQQDSHELLRYLLDGLHTEEVGARKALASSDEDSNASNVRPTMVDAIFGGQLSSTVCCVVCGHSSVVYEPFLDLSLSVPTKKSLSKKARPVTRSKKAKPQVKKEINKCGKARLKGKADITPVLVQCATGSAESENSLCQPPSSAVVKEDAAGSYEGFWLDFCQGEASIGIDSDSQNCGISVNPNSGNKVEILPDDLDSRSQASSPKGEPKPDLIASWDDSFEEEVPLQVKDFEVLLLPYTEESLTAEVTNIDDGASSSVVGCGQGTVDFDGFGDLFNEPEVASTSNTETWLHDKTNLDDDVMGMVASTVKSSDSDPDEVDDRDAPVSINSCLVHFTKPELLMNEHAWHCENCSKILQQEMERRKTIVRAQINGDQCRNATASLHSESISTERTNLVNGMHKGPLVDADKFDCPLDVYPVVEIRFSDDEMNPEFSETMSNCLPKVSDNGKGVLPGYALLEESGSQVRFRDQGADICDEEEPYTVGSKVDQVERSIRIQEFIESNETKDAKSNYVEVLRDATKRILINSAPKILTIHLKRFSQDPRGHRLSKLSGHVGFCETLNLRPHMDPSSKDTSGCSYLLVGVVVHSGSMSGGHYVAYIRGAKCKGKTENEDVKSTWFYASDSHVREVSLAEVLSCEAYLLFYEKVSFP